MKYFLTYDIVAGSWIVGTKLEPDHSCGWTCQFLRDSYTSHLSQKVEITWLTKQQ